MATLRRTAVASFGRLGQTNVPTWSLAVLVAVLGWEIGFPTGSHSLDPSWMAGLNMGAHEGLIFGSEIVFTYGPLGFLKGPMVWYSDIAALSYLYQAGTFYFFVLLLILNLRPRIGAVSACVTAFLAIVWLPGIDFAIGIATLWAFYVLSGPEKVQLWPLASVGAVFAAAECLMKLSTGPLILIVMLMTMAGCRAKRLEWVRFGLLFVAAFISLYLIAGQALGDLPDFLRFSYQVVSGYPEGMSDYTQGVSTAIALSFVTAITCVWAWFGSYPDNRRRVAATLVAGAIGFSFYKAGVIRADANHLAISYTTFAILWIAIPIVRARLPVALIGMVALGAVAIHQFPYSTGVDVIANAKGAGKSLRTFLSESRRQDVVDLGRLQLQVFYDLDPRVVGEIQGRSVSIDPYEIAAAWAYELDWSPLPVFQNYSAYTTELDEMNAESVASVDGPDRILRSNVRALDPQYRTGTVDGRFPGWDPPSQAIATICNFTPTVTTQRWQVLSRTANRCGSAVPAGTVEGQDGQPVPVPEAGDNEVVFVRVQGVEVDGLEKLVSLVYRPGIRTASTSDGRTYRLVPGTASDGLLLRSKGVAGQDRGPFSQIPQTTSIEIHGAGGNLTFEFFRMKVRPPAIRR